MSVTDPATPIAATPSAATPRAGTPAAAKPTAGPLTVRPITAQTAQRVLLELDGSFYQTPAWADSKPDWRQQFLGWFDGEDIVGVGLALGRSLPKVGRSFIYLPEGPALPWETVAQDPSRWVDPLVAWARSAGGFALRLGFPVVSRRWAPGVVKDKISESGLMSFREVTPTLDNPVARRLESYLDSHDWTPIGWGTTAAVGQPRYVCVIELAGRTPDEVLRSMNQQWRRNIKKATKAGVQVRAVQLDGIDTFHELYVETAHRDHFFPRAKVYFERMVREFADASGQTDGAVDAWVYEAHVDGDVLASAVMVRVGGMFSYLYGGSTSRNRDARASNALQWQAIQDAIALGCHSYDFRGFNTSLGADSPLIGLLLFKLGAGADVVELVGERELVLNRFWHTAFDKAMAARVWVNEKRSGAGSAQPGADG